MAGEEDEEYDKVMTFWFDGDLKQNYKNKWFPSGSTELQNLADTVVHELFSSIFERAISGCLSHWTESKRSTIALIVILDQFSRHLYRQLPSDDERRIQADNLALDTAVRFTSSIGWDSGLSVPEFVFSLMPLRHSATISRLKFVRSELSRRQQSIIQESELLAKFEKQTFRRLQHLQDRAKAEASDEILERFAIITDESDIFSHPLVRATASFLDRMAVRPGQTLIVSLSGGVDSMVILKILAVLRLGLGAPTKISETSTQQKDRRENGEHPPSPVLCLHIDYANRPESVLEARFLQDWVHEINTQALAATGVQEQTALLDNIEGRDRESLAAIVSQRMLCELRVRRIEEVTRGVTDRDFYERFTREIRYALYRDALLETGAGGVMLGHHQDDLRENVISNVMRGCSAVELSGMAEIGETEGAIVWRPLLSFPKKDILDFAHRYGVPYFKDTTPSWSTRGKLRTQLIPLLEDIYGAGFSRNLSNLAHNSDETADMMRRFVYEPFHSSLRRFSCGLIAETAQFTDHPLTFWRTVLRDMMHSQHRGLVRDASVAAFVTRLKRRREKDLKVYEWVELRKGAAARLTESGHLVLMKTGVLRGDGEEKGWDSRLPPRISLHISDENSNEKYECGDWSLTYRSSHISLDELTAVSPQLLVQLQPKSKTNKGVHVVGLGSGEDAHLLSGKLSYSLILPLCCNHLIPFCLSKAATATTTFSSALDKRLLQGLPIYVGEVAVQEGPFNSTGYKRIDVEINYNELGAY